MKLHIGLALITSVASVSAYQLAFTNRTVFGSPSLPIVLDNVGQALTPIGSGSLQVGTFASDDDVTRNAGDFTALLAGFTPANSTVITDFGSAVDGIVDLGNANALDFGSIPEGTTGGAIGQSIYVVIGNADTLAASSNLAVFKSNTVFGTDSAATGVVTDNVDFQSTLGSVLLGSSNPISLTAGANTIDYANSIGLVAVPEPTTGLLASLAGLALLARRRR